MFAHTIVESPKKGAMSLAAAISAPSVELPTANTSSSRVGIRPRMRVRVWRRLTSYPSSGMSTSTAVQKWVCESCGFIYDPEEGDPDGGIPAGTAFDDIPSDWFCPVCGARKADFSPYED